MNAVLHGLMNTPLVKEYFLQESLPKELQRLQVDKEEKRLVEDFRELIKLEWQPYKGVGGFGFGAHKIYQSYQLQPNIKIENE